MALLKKKIKDKKLTKKKDIKKIRQKGHWKKDFPSKISRLLIRPIISEKATKQKKNNQYIFEVSLRAQSKEIKRSIEFFYKVKVLKVNVVKMKGKNKKFKTSVGRRKNWKKAVVKLKKGQIIET